MPTNFMALAGQLLQTDQRCIPASYWILGCQFRRVRYRIFKTLPVCLLKNGRRMFQYPMTSYFPIGHAAQSHIRGEQIVRR